MYRRALRYLWDVLTPHFYKEPVDKILTQIYSPHNFTIILSRLYGVEAEFVREYRKFSRDCLVKQYSRWHIILSYTDVGVKIFCHESKKPNWFQRYFISKRFYNELQIFTAEQLSSLTGKSVEEVKKDLSILRYFISVFQRPSTKKGLERALDILKVALKDRRIPSTSLLFLSTVGLNCNHCDFGTEDYDRLQKLLPELQNEDLVHLLLCTQERKLLFEEFRDDPEARKKTFIAKTDPISARGIPGLRQAYTKEEIERLTVLLKEKTLSRKFVKMCFLEYALLVSPEDLVEVKELSTGISGSKIDLWTISSYFHRKVAISQVRTVYEFFNSGSVSFSEARQLAEAGVVPEIAELLSGEKRWLVQDIVSLHRMVQNYGLGEVRQVLDHYNGAFQRTANFWSWYRRNPGKSLEEVFHLIEESSTSLTSEKPRFVSRKKRREREQRANLELVPQVSAEEAYQPQLAVYQNVSVSQLPNLSGNKMYQLLQQCGWVKLTSEGSHYQLRKGPWRVSFVHTGSKHTSRYTLYYEFRNSRVSEEEVKLVINTWKGKGKNLKQAS